MSVAPVGCSRLRGVGVMAVVVASLSLPAAAPAARATEFSKGLEDSGPDQIAAGPDGNLWFTGHQIARITPTGRVKEYETNGVPHAIAVGPDGNLWCSDGVVNRILRITPSGAVTSYENRLSDNAYPEDIAAGADGNLWFTESAPGKIGRITPDGRVTEFPVTSGDSPEEIAAGPDGNLWFTELTAGRIGRITPSGTVTEFEKGITSGAGPMGIAAGPDGNLWFTELGRNAIGRITPAGTVTEFGGITAGAAVSGITAGPDGNLWFTEHNRNKVARITPAGAVTEYARGISSGPEGIAAGPDGNLWFTETGGDRIGRIATGSPARSSGNLLRNPGFELGVPVISDAATAPVPGWAAMPNFTAVSYTAGSGFPGRSVHDLIDGRTAFAAGGPNSPASRAIQRVDVSRRAGMIDDGRASVTLAGFLGGYAADPDAASLIAIFQSGRGKPLGRMAIGAVTPADRNQQTALLSRSKSRVVPDGTRSIRVVALAARNGTGSYNDAYFDNLSLEIKRAPLLSELEIAPSSFPATGSGGAGGESGTRVSYKNSDAGTTRFTVLRVMSGRKVNGTCRRPSKSNRDRPRCTRAKVVRGFSRRDVAGENRFHFKASGLSAGHYRLRAVPTTVDGRVGKPAAQPFAIVGG